MFGRKSTPARPTPHEDARLNDALAAGNRKALAKRDTVRAKDFATHKDAVQAADAHKHKFPYYGGVVCNVAGQEYTLFSVNDDVVAWMFFWTGTYETPLMDLWDQLTKRGGTSLDIGAYTGLYAMVAARNGCNAHAFELLLRTAERAKVNFRLNGLEKAIKLHPYGLSNQTGHVEVKMPRHADFLGTGNSIDDKSFAPSVETTLCQVRSMDEVAKAEGLKDVRSVKIDVEGHEYELLSAMRPLIERNKPDMIVELSRRQDECRALLAEMGYDVLPLLGANVHAKPKGT
ncbi:MAG: FkbM family methyltransferase [Pseudomonadota bacterium]